MSVNYSPIQSLQAVIQGQQELTSPVVSMIQKRVADLQDSEGRSQESISALLAGYAGEKLFNIDDATPVKNAKQLTAYTPSSGKLSPAVRVLVAVAPKLSSPDRRQVCAIATDHILYPTQSKNTKGKITGISGGHVIDYYTRGQLQSPCVVSQDKKTIAVFTTQGGKKKTLASGKDAATIIEQHKTSTTVGYKRSGVPGVDDLTIRQTVEGQFIGGYSCRKRLLVESTQFPLLVADKHVKNESGLITLATLAKLKTDYSGVENREDLVVSPDSFDRLIAQGSPIEMINQGGIIITDITQPVQVKFNAKLTQNGFPKSQLASNLYGVTRTSTEV